MVYDTLCHIWNAIHHIPGESLQVESQKTVELRNLFPYLNDVYPRVVLRMFAEVFFDLLELIDL